MAHGALGGFGLCGGCCSGADELEGSKHEELGLLTRMGRAHLLLFSLNEGKQRLPPGRLEAALDLALQGVPAGSSPPTSAAASEGPRPAGVVVARQEAVETTATQWDAALAARGFPHRIAEVSLKIETSLLVYAADAEDFKVVHAFSVSSNEAALTSPAAGADAEGDPKKGVAGVVLEHGGLRLCLGSVHLDGNVPAEQRIRCVSAAVLQAAAGAGSSGGRALDAALLLGDINYTMVGTPLALAGSGDRRRAAVLLEEEYRKVLAEKDKRGTYQLPDELKDLMQSCLATSEGRSALKALDGCPEIVQLRGEGNGEVARTLPDVLKLQEMPPGSFPTYRLCNIDNAAFHGLTAAGAADPQVAAAQGAIRLRPSLETSTEVVRDTYFRDANKGTSGAIKKRGDTCRLNLGWLDRLYIGCKGAPAHVLQSDPVFLLGEGGAPLDHTLMLWEVKL